MVQGKRFPGMFMNEKFNNNIVLLCSTLNTVFVQVLREVVEIACVVDITHVGLFCEILQFLSVLIETVGSYYYS